MLYAAFSASVFAHSHLSGVYLAVPSISYFNCCFIPFIKFFTTSAWEWTNESVKFSGQSLTKSSNDL